MPASFRLKGPLQAVQFLFVAATVVRASSPAQIPWSKTTYGPDGPWWAVTLQVGTPPQPVDVLPQGAGACYVLSDSYCASVQGGQCSFFNTSRSETYDASWSQWANNPSWQAPVPTYGSWHYSTDIITVPVQGGGNLTANQTVQIVTSGGIEIGTQGQTSANFRLGTLSLGNPTVQNTIPGTEVLVNKYTSDQFAAAGDIPSASFGLHYGSVTAGVMPSLVFGGYDRNRVFGQPITTSISVDAYPLLELSSIAIGTAIGSSPWPSASNASLNGLLKQDQATTDNGLLPVKVDPGNPYILLPAETCQAIAAALPVTYNSANQLFYWNTTDPMFERIVGGATYLGFTFSAAGTPDVTIKVPFKLLNLTLESPLANGGFTQYFPCLASNGEEFGLGRAFLQAAFYGGNWQPQASGEGPSIGPGAWTLAQAPGPNTASPDIQSLSPTQNMIIQTNLTWEDSWSGHWQPLQTDGSSSAQAAPLVDPHGGANGAGTSLPSAAIIGIAVGATALAGLIASLVVCMILRRRRRRRRVTRDPARQRSLADAMAVKQVQHPAELLGRPIHDERFELYDAKGCMEMSTEPPRAEMACYIEPVEVE